MRIPQIIPVLSFFFALAHAESEATTNGVESTALRPLILRANTYLSVGQFSDAARSYTEAIGTLTPRRNRIVVLTGHD